MNEKPANLAACPTCKKKGNWFIGKYGPFCSHRCKLIDLGKWLDAQHAISEPIRPDLVEKMEAEG